MTCVHSSSASSRTRSRYRPSDRAASATSTAPSGGAISKIGVAVGRPDRMRAAMRHLNPEGWVEPASAAVGWVVTPMMVRHPAHLAFSE